MDVRMRLSSSRLVSNSWRLEKKNLKWKAERVGVTEGKSVSTFLLALSLDARPNVIISPHFHRPSRRDDGKRACTNGRYRCLCSRLFRKVHRVALAMDCSLLVVIQLHSGCGYGLDAILADDVSAGSSWPSLGWPMVPPDRRRKAVERAETLAARLHQ